MDLQRVDDTDFSGGSRKRMEIEVGNCSRWSELPADLLVVILKQLGVIEFLLFACVCKSWRFVAIALKQEFMASQSPLVFLMPTKARKYGYFYNIFDNGLYKAGLPHLAGNKCVGFTCGYLVLRDSEMTKKKANIWLVNPFTRHELKFPSPPRRYCHVIVASLAKSDPEFVIVAFSRLHPFVQFCTSRHGNWTIIEYNKEDPLVIVDVTVFKGKIYILSRNGQIGTLNLNSDHLVTYLQVRSVSCPIDNLHLVASHEELYLARFYAKAGPIKVHRLDFVRMEWEKVKLNGEILFLGDMKCCGLSFPTPSKARTSQPLNRVCYLEDARILGGYRARYVAGSTNEHVQVTRKDGKPKIFISSPVWYFPHLSTSVDSVDED
ncbi:F-box/kelch-repeat protein At1g57790-like [Durio zibethinus]|uniref:F-box/kelch-repeat protein At1g57790-like n=1 Tax=Durio zibethinus TaxID=66656 RepID=A0A6P6BEI1_DURZI|nr:F-box/kelch-repeat protein At1g57790-like [Durio zibethinus]